MAAPGFLRMPLCDGETVIQAFTPVNAQGYPYLTVYQTGVGTISGGTILIEEAPTFDYAGLWSLILTLDATDVSGGATQATACPPGAYSWVRARITATITGGGNESLLLVGC